MKKKNAMSPRLKIIINISAIVAIVCVTNLAISLMLTQDNLYRLTIGDMKVVANIANEYISSQINLLKSEAETTAIHLNEAKEADIPALLERLIKDTPAFTALTIIDKKGIISEYGENPVPDYLLDSEYIQRALNGESIISTTRVEEDGDCVFHVCVPMRNGRVLSATIDGMYFTDCVKSFHVWDSGNIFILDSEGTIIANIRENWVKERFSPIVDGKANPNDPSAVSMMEFAQKMLTEKDTSGEYIVDGRNRIAVSVPVSGSKAGWLIGVAAPIDETPISQLQNALFMISIIFLVACIVIAIFVSRNIARPMIIMEEQNKRLDELRRDAEIANETKSNFLANTSHEMRTPLNAVIGLSELQLSREDLDPEARTNLTKISNSGNVLLNIINDLLDISKIESGKFELINSEYDVPSMVNNTVTLNIMRLGSKPIEFKLNIDAHMPTRLIGDELRVKQIFNNLLSNAFKYTKQGEVEWTINHKTDGEDIWITSSVRDTGVGIRPEDIQKLFAEYNQVDVKSNRTIEGTGLGLSILRHLVDLMDGEVSVDSKYGEGSIFTVKFKQKRATYSTIGSVTAENLKRFRYNDGKRADGARLLRADLSYARILIVDDVVTNLDVAKGMMRPYNMQIDCVTSGPEAVNLIRRGDRYNAIFMDHMMPIMDGIEAVRIIREEIGTEYARTVPIIALTANATVGNDKMFMKHGFQAFISKPIDIKELDVTINRWVRDREYEREHGLNGESNAVDNINVTDDTAPQGEGREAMAPQPVAQAGAAAPFGRQAEMNDAETGDKGSGNMEISPITILAEAGIEGLNVGAGLERFAGDVYTYIDVLSSYAGSTSELLGKLKSHIEMGDLGAYAVAVHGMKGSSRGVAADELGTAAEELEKAAKAGDADFVAKHTADFISRAEALVSAISNITLRLRELEDKPVKDEPEKDMLLKLILACESFAMDEADRILGELEKYSYNKHDSLIGWMKGKLSTMRFEEVAERLKEHIGSVGHTINDDEKDKNDEKDSR